MRSYIAVLIAIAFLLGACTGEDRSALNLADAIMEENPDSALAILQGIDRDKLGSRDLPYYALLMTQAKIKTDVPLVSDSLISIAYSKYADEWRGDRGIRSNFYMGEIFFNQEKYRDAMKYYLSAYEEAKRLDNDYWHAKAAERIADIFFDAFNYVEAAKYRMTAIEYFGKSEKMTNQRYAIADLAEIYGNDHKPELAIHILDSLLHECNKSPIKDQHLITYILRYKDPLIINNDNTNDSSKIYNITPMENRTNLDIIEDVILSCKLGQNKNDRLRNDSVLRSIVYLANDKEDSLQILYARYLNYRMFEPETPFIKLMDSLFYLQESLTRDVLIGSVNTAESEFFLDQSIRNRQKLHRYFIIFSIIIIIAVLGAFLIWKTLNLRNSARTAELEANIEALVSLNSHIKKISAEKTLLGLEIKNKESTLTYLYNQLIEQKTKSEMFEREAEHFKKQIDDITHKHLEYNEKQSIIMNNLEHQINDYKRDINLLKLKYHDNDTQKSLILEKLFKEKWSTLNMLCLEYFEKSFTPKLRDGIIKKIESEVNSIGSSDGLRQIEEEVNRYMNGIVSMLRKECPNIKEADIALFSLICAGFSVKAICLILNIDSNNVYVKKNRLIKKINATSSPQKDIFLDRLK